MTTLPEAREAIYNHWITEWANRTVFTLDNEEFTPPVNDYWARFVVRHQAGRQETLGKKGNRKFARHGAAYTQIFLPLNVGMDLGDSHVLRAQEIFEGVSLPGTTVRFYDVTPREGGRQDDSFLVVVEADFEYDETK